MTSPTQNQSSDFEYVAPQTDAYGAVIVKPVETVTKATNGEDAGAWGSSTFHNLEGGARASGEVLSAHSLLKAADLDWDPEFVPLMAGAIQVPKDIGRGVVRSDTKFPIGVVGARYTLVPHKALATLADALQKTEGTLSFGNAGHKHNGARPFIQMTRERLIPGSKVAIKDLVTLMTSHDGSLQVMAAYGACVIVCDNTYAHALSATKGRGITIRHTASATSTLEEAIRIAEAANKMGASFDNAALKLMGTKFSDERMTRLACALIPGESTRAENNRQKLMDLWVSGAGAAPGTGWGASQAVTNYTSHVISTRGDETDRAYGLATGEGSGSVLQGAAWAYLQEDGFEALDKVEIIKHAVGF
jgi:phage/plasmid-like protein (TIGR03299 family)